MKKVFRSKLSGIIVITILAAVFSLSGYFVYERSQRTSIKSFNEETYVFAKLSTGMLINNYSLYHDSGSLKFDEIIADLLDKDQLISHFEITNTEGDVLYVSNTSKASTAKYTSEKDLDDLRSFDPTIKYHTSGRIQEIIFPHIEDWGSHQYTIKFTVSSEKLEKNLSVYRFELVIATFFLFILSSFPIIRLFVMRGYEMQKEEKDRLKELNKQKDSFMTLVAHNLRTPITILKGYANLAGETSLSKIEKEYVDAIVEGTERLNNVTETIIKVNEILSGDKIQKTPGDINEITAESIEDLIKAAKEKKVKITFKTDSSIGMIPLNKEYVKKAISSLIDNAIKFNKEKGSVSLSIKKQKENVVFEIKDTGIGISNEDIKTIFTSFHRAVKDPLNYDYSGLGMGLYLTKVVVEAHDGQIWAESKAGKGSTFSFSLPIKN